MSGWQLLGIAVSPFDIRELNTTYTPQMQRVATPKQEWPACCSENQHRPTANFGGMP